MNSASETFQVSCMYKPGEHFSGQHFEIFFLENSMWHFMHIVRLRDNLQGVRSYFLEKNIINLLSYPREW